MEITLEILKERYSQKLYQLLECGSNSLAKEEPLIYKEMGISENDALELLKMALDRDFEKLIDYDNEEEFFYHEEHESPEFLAEYSSAHALQALIELKYDKASQQLMDNFDTINLHDDYYLYAFDDFFATNWSTNVNLFEKVLFDKEASHEKRVRIFYIFEEIVKKFEDKEDLKAIEDRVIKFLKSDEKDEELNALAINYLVLIKGVEHIELIRECFKTKSIDGLYADSLEDIEIAFGLREKATPKPVAPQKEKSKEPTFTTKTVGRNDPCPCGSGKKYKKCCLNK